MDWSPQQDAALLSVNQWLAEGKSQVFRLFGYAGTGKTTLAKHFAEGVDGDVRFAAFTGKAAQVLRQNGCVGASTIHSLMYRAREKNRKRLLELEQKLVEASNEYTKIQIQEAIRIERQSLSRPAFDMNASSDLRQLSLIVIDECSMVDDRMGEDLMSLGVKILVLGDPAQLPPVKGGGFFTEGRGPDVMLTEIHRQAKDNPIIALATDIREGKALEIGSYGESRVVSRYDLDPDTVYSSDQLLVGKNVTRRASNLKFRARAGFEGSPFPQTGEKLICLRNNHDLGLLNGSLWTSTACVPGTVEERVALTLEPHEGGEELSCEAHAFHFLGQPQDVMPWYERLEANEFDYGYAITVHKSQGSQWGSVVLLDEWTMRDSRQRWLYTAVTRAREKVTVVRM